MTKSGPWRDYSRSRAVLIGAWDYTHLPPVPAARTSLERMASLLTGPLCEWPAQQRVKVLRNVRRRDRLPDQLMDLFDGVVDVALFYFVGHGQLHGDELCLALRESPEAGPRRMTTGLPFADVRSALRECDARTKIVILDCCFAGIGTRSEHSLAATSADVIDKTAGTGAFTMAASGAYRTAWFESDPAVANPQTYFTKYLIDVIEQGLPGYPEGLPLGPIFSHTADTLARDRRPEPTRSIRHDADRFILARNTTQPTTFPASAPTSPATAHQPPGEAAPTKREHAEPTELAGPGARTRRGALSRRGFVIGALGLIGAGAAGGAAWALWPEAGKLEAGKLTGDDTTGIAFSRDSGTLISTHHPYNVERAVRLWDVDTRDPLAEVDGTKADVQNPVVHPDGKSFATNEEDSLILRDVRTGVIVKDKYGFDDNTDLSYFAADPEITFFAISPDGVLLAIGTAGDGPVLVDIVGREVVTRLIPEGYDTDRSARAVTELAFSPDGRRLAVAGDVPPRDTDWVGMEEYGCTVWDIADRRAESNLLAEPTHSVAYGPAGDTIATAGTTGVRLWDASTGDIRATFIGEETHSLAFSPDGKALLTGGVTGVRLWDIGTGSLKRELSDNYVHWVAFSPDGKAVAAATEDSNTSLSPGCWLWRLD